MEECAPAREQFALILDRLQWAAVFGMEHRKVEGFDLGDVAAGMRRQLMRPPPRGAETWVRRAGLAHPLGQAAMWPRACGATLCDLRPEECKGGGLPRQQYRDIRTTAIGPTASHGHGGHQGSLPSPPTIRRLLGVSTCPRAHAPPSRNGEPRLLKAAHRLPV